MYNQVYWSPPITSQEAALAHNSSINFPPPLQQPTISPPSVSTPPATLPPPPASSPPPPATSPPPPAPAPPTGLFQLPATAGAAAGLGVEVAAPRVAAGKQKHPAYGLLGSIARLHAAAITCRS